MNELKDVESPCQTVGKTHHRSLPGLQALRWDAIDDENYYIDLEDLGQESAVRGPSSLFVKRLAQELERLFAEVRSPRGKMEEKGGKSEPSSESGVNFAMSPCAVLSRRGQASYSSFR